MILHCNYFYHLPETTRWIRSCWRMSVCLCWVNYCFCLRFSREGKGSLSNN